MVPSFRCTFLPDMPSSLTPGSSSSSLSSFSMSTRPSPRSERLGAPEYPAIRSRGARISRLHWFASATACQVARSPLTDQTGASPATGSFYFQASNGSVFLPVAGYNYNSDWTPLLAGLSPARMAASLAAPTPSSQWTFTTYSLPVSRRTHFCYGPVTRGLPLGDLVDRLQSFSFHHLCYPNYGALTSTPAGLSPAEHASLRWTHNRTCRSPASGSRTRLHAFTHDTSCPSRLRHTSPKCP